MQISLTKALKVMEQKDELGNPIPFSIIFCTADRKKKSGGEIISLDNVVLSRKKRGTSGDSESDSAKKPNHYINFTRNIKILSSDNIRKVHGRLIGSINGHNVYW